MIRVVPRRECIAVAQVSKSINRCKQEDADGTPAYMECRRACDSSDACPASSSRGLLPPAGWPLWIYNKGLAGMYQLEGGGGLDSGDKEPTLTEPGSRRREFVATSDIFLYEMHKSKSCDDDSRF